MVKELVGRKCGMTRLFLEDGQSVPVSVIHVEPNMVTQLKSVDSDGYSAIQVTMGKKKRSRINKPIQGIYAKAGVEPGVGLWELSAEPADLEALQPGAEIKVDVFEAGQKVDVTGVSKGKGFAGVVKRHNFAMQDATHGNSVSHRAHGSTGQNQTPGRVFKGKKMAGQMGNVQKTIQSLEVVRVDLEKNLLLVKGGVPGATGCMLKIKASVKGGK